VNLRADGECVPERRGKCCPTADPVSAGAASSRWNLYSPARRVSCREGPEAIIPLSKTGGGLLGGVTVNAPITISGPVVDSGNLAAILAEHARERARQVRRTLEIEYETEAVV
jgi:hypothetical protein